MNVFLNLGALEGELNASLPFGMSVGFDREYPVMVSYKKKNHALLDQAGRIIIKGGTLRSRACEPYLSRYKAAVLELLLTGREDDIPALYESTVRALRNRELPIRDLARSQTLNDTVDEYLAKVANARRNEAAAYEAIISAGRNVVRGDKVAFYATLNGEKRGEPIYKRAKLTPLETLSPDQIRDEDLEGYIRKLEKTAVMFDIFAPHR